MLIATLGIGTELTTGQIIDRNSSWISKNLKELGVPTSCHLVVPDDRALILDALKFLSERCDTLFVTGGLGPTSDDFTRDLISEWSKKPLEFDEASWQHVNQRLSSRAIQVREIQRQQCYFPQGAKILTNPEGTANAFQMKIDNKDVFVLPGPPAEIAAVWRESIGSYLREKTKGIDPLVTYSWDTMGLGESDVAHITETCLAGVEIEKGYRVHLPYVEVKVSFLESQKASMMKLVEKLDEALRNITVTRNGEDVPQLMVKKFTTVKKIEVVDSLTGQVLTQRMMPVLKSYMSANSWSFSSSNGYASDPQTLKMVLKGWDAHSAIAEIHYKGASFKTIFEVPFMISKMNERKALYFTERALIFWLQKLGDLV
jgi:nicotinamide-nucleotide amidase